MARSLYRQGERMCSTLLPRASAARVDFLPGGRNHVCRFVKSTRDISAREARLESCNQGPRWYPIRFDLSLIIARFISALVKSNPRIVLLANTCKSSRIESHWAPICRTLNWDRCSVSRTGKTSVLALSPTVSPVRRTRTRCMHLNFAVARSDNGDDVPVSKTTHVHGGCRRDRALPFLRQFTKVNPPRTIDNLPLHMHRSRSKRNCRARIIEQFY